MAVINRDLDSSQQVKTISVCITDAFNSVEGSSTPGQTFPLFTVPYPAKLIGAKMVPTGLSGAPNMSLWIGRFVPGAGMTSINIGSSIVAVVFTTSGAQSFAVPGNVTYPLQQGDQLYLGVREEDTGAKRVAITMVIRALQDIKSSFGQVLS